jgi:RNA polymerase sigma-70 factor (subfamily 1)
VTPPNERDGSTQRLVAAVRRGDRGEFDALLEPHRAFLREVIHRGMDARLRAVLEPEDVMQDVMLAAYRGLAEARFPSEAAFRGWLETLARNRLIDLVRRHFKTERRLHPAVSLDETAAGSEGVHLREAIPAYGPGASTIATRREEAEALEQILKRLPAHHREIIRLLEIERLSTAEIAVRLGKKPATLRKALARALKACRDAMKKSGRAPGDAGR